ncbi:hypothetical protein C7974DRAFT_298597 [Boeremia exigua]|uniref:uncharacterized protein n=1 Tax=Boeremia exigua TaxID=749465 RepID=UPI001E8E2FAA|nr:uncharacterized protein C7974DRAFT_298597 [Boeremia exigua]KAH6644534.1 hypothetical protein C7974DRAFT_298597 [Boeremia exigua]
MPFFTSPQALRLRDLAANPNALVSMASQSFDYGNNGGFVEVFKKKAHSSHPDFANLTLLVFEAVMEVVCVSAPGYIIARMGQFDAESQKFLANLNTQLFTPCLIFTKLASQLTAEKLGDLAVIPIIFVIQTLISYLAAIVVGKLFGFKKRQSNFVTAMAVFGNSNSLPISLVISLSKTISGLHWDRMPGDNDNEVGARGILYLLIFQQLGQLVRWTWGFNVLLAPADTYKKEDGGTIDSLESGEYSEEEAQRLLDDSHSDYESGNVTSYATSAETSDTDSIEDRGDILASASFATPTNGNVAVAGEGDFHGRTNGNANGHVNGDNALASLKKNAIPKGPKGWPKRVKAGVQRTGKSISNSLSRAGRSIFESLPKWLQRTLSAVSSFLGRFAKGVWAFMNPPLWAMLAAIIVASVPQLQHLFFSPGTFINTSLTRAVNQSGQVAVPLILVVLGANLARNTLPKQDQHSLEDPKVEKKLVIASLISRMLIPTLAMAPILALIAKYVPVSIVDDPIFIIVCFLLSGAPTALQLAQICQINNVYMGAMSNILFQSYVVFILPSTLLLVMLALETQPESSEVRRSNTVEGSASPRASTKVVSFPDEGISPLMIAKQKELEQKDYLDLDRPSRHYPASISGKRLSGRPSIESMGSFKPQSQSGEPKDGNPSLTSLLSESSNDAHHHAHTHERLVKHVQSWLKSERTRRASRKAKRKAAKNARQVDESQEVSKDQTEAQQTSRGRSDSDSSDGSVALDQLTSILEKTLNITPADAKRKINHVRRMSTGLKRHSAVSVDSDYFDSIDTLVPSCDVVLDNSKTMAYSIDDADHEPENEDTERRRRKEKEAWTTFRYEILRLAHTLKLKGWRRVAMEQHDEVDVQRLSGALTNAVYVVSPPKNIKPKEERTDGAPMPKNPPPKLLLRIYGPQVDHLIDRESELQILQRLGRKRIGPRMLGTFKNGRFEEFFHAKPLTFKELRVAETSKQIAKRMRELHEGIELLKSEREAGPFVWQNWDKWVDRCEQVVTWLDQQILENGDAPITTASDRWRKRGLICGVEWPIFRQMIEKYRKWLEEQYGGLEKINERMVFAHNDTQYGNILRMMPEGESPLLLPANQHKQLVVIDFEYSNANVPGLEFANHFTEWCYNYHDPDYPWACASNYYPTSEEQHRFIRAYLMHTPGLKTPGGASSNPPTPHLGPLPTSASTTALAATAAPSSISAFMLDSRAPPGQSYQEQEAQAERNTEEEAHRLMAETKLWRVACSAMWVAWGIVQAHVPGLPDFDAVENGASDGPAATALDGATTDVEIEAEKEEEKTPAVSTKESEPIDEDKPELDQDADLFKSQDDEEFDYLAYAQDRAMFVWGDLVGMGLVKMEDLPETLRQRLKIVEY